MPETSPPPLRILHLTDTHLYGDDSLHYGVVDTGRMLADTLRHLDRLRELDLVVCSGDVSEDGSAESYRRAAAALEPWARARGARVVYAMGNHDVRGAFRAVLGDGQSGPAASTAGPADPVLSVGLVRGHRVVVLDSSVPRAGYGRLGPDQLDWLRLQLATPAEHGTVLVVHHPPVAAETVLLNALALQDGEDLLAAIDGSDVRVVLCGHYHFAAVEWQGTVPIVVSAAVANQARVVDDPAQESAGFGAGGSLLTLPTGGGVRVLPFTVPDSRAPQEVFRLDRETVARVAEQAGPAGHGERPELRVPRG